MTPAVLAQVAAEFEAVEQELRMGLAAVDAETTETLGGSWSGAAASSYAVVWQEWHAGSSKILAGLATMSTLLTEAAARYSRTDDSSAAGIDGAGL